ncbi:O-antigen ligase family protein, partial [uncultured Bacteroides sp.]|uniref:O-antigen ligase family protein n=2 Tax=uncultured Bacteroides sp. TaxID=162156 RepID=UPI002605B697
LIRRSLKRRFYGNRNLNRLFKLKNKYSDAEVYRCFGMRLKLQDILLIGIGFLLLCNRAIPIDCSSLWQLGTLFLVYIAIRILPKKSYPVLLLVVCLSGAVETAVAVLQNFHYWESNHHVFAVTGTFGNPGPLGGFLATCFIVSVSLFRANGGKLNIYCRILCVILIIFIAYGLVLTSSRAGWLAALIGVLFLFCSRYPLSCRMKILVCTVVGVFIVALYFLKVDSANGRLFIWRNTWEMIKDSPIRGTGTGGWLANYMHYQANYFMQHPDSVYASLADNVFYPYNEILHFVAEQGAIGLLCLLSLFYALLGKRSNNNVEWGVQGALVSFIVFSCFSYPADIFRLQILFVSMMGMMRGRQFNIAVSQKMIRVTVGLIVLSVVSISGWSFVLYQRTSSEIKHTTFCPDSLFLANRFPLFRYNPQLMYYYSQRCVVNKCPTDNTLQILQSTSSIVPTCELYCDIGDIWLLKKDTTQAEMCYHIAASMLPYRLTPKYKTFLLYVNQGNRKSAIDIGEKILNQPIKKEGTKTLRIKAEIIQYMQNCRESVNNTKE